MTTTFLRYGTEIAVLDVDDELRRVSAEFLEMPDLVVTVAQASRLFGVEHDESQRILDTLVNRGILSTDGRQFARAGLADAVFEMKVSWPYREWSSSTITRC